MAVAFEATATDTANGTSKSFSITLGGSSSTRAVMVGFSGFTNTTGMSGTIGGESLSIISGTDGGATIGTVLLGKATSLTGSQTISMSWTTSQSCVLGAISATGVDQTTPFNNGTTVS